MPNPRPEDHQRPAYGETPYRPPSWQAAPARKSKAPLIVGILAGLLLLCTAGGVGLIVIGGDAVHDAAQEIEQNTQGQNAVDTAVGKPARDGKFEFTVKKIECGVMRVGTKDFGARPQGQFCLVDVTVKNIGTEAQMFDGSSQYAYDDEGTEFAHSGEAAGHVNDGDDTTFLQQINPGNQVAGTLVFDVPVDAKITSVVLHDSLFSGGVRVKFV
jgi:hypothetical protein